VEAERRRHRRRAVGAAEPGTGGRSVHLWVGRAVRIGRIGYKSCALRPDMPGPDDIDELIATA
jgi:hypothetical protein